MVQTPNRQQMGGYIHEGMQATFKKMAHLKHLMIIENELRDGLAEILASVYADPAARLAFAGSGDGADPMRARPAPMSRAPSELHRKLAQSAVSPQPARRKQPQQQQGQGQGLADALPDEAHGSSSSLSSSVAGGVDLGGALAQYATVSGDGGGGAGGVEGGGGGRGAGGGANGKEGEAAQSLRRISSLALAQVSAALTGRSRKDEARTGGADEEPDGASIIDALSGFGGGGGEAASVGGDALATRRQRPETPPAGGRELVAVAPGGGGGGGGTLALPPGTLAKLVHEKQVLQERLSVAEAKNERLEATLHHMQEVIYHAVGGATGLPVQRSSSRGRGLAGLG